MPKESDLALLLLLRLFFDANRELHLHYIDLLAICEEFYAEVQVEKRVEYLHCQQAEDSHDQIKAERGHPLQKEEGVHAAFLR